MLKDCEEIFKDMEAPRVPDGLFDKIMRRIDDEIHFAAVKRRLIFFSILFSISVASFVPAFQMAREEFYNSGFAEFLGLIFSDLNSALTYWQNFAVALLESLPVISSVAVLAIVFVFLQSLKFLAQDIRLFKNI